MCIMIPSMYYDTCKAMASVSILMPLPTGLAFY